MAIFLFFAGLSIKESWNLAAFIMIILFVIAFQLSQGAYAWLYVPEVCVDSATGLAVASQFINLTVISLTFEYMINSVLKVFGTIWYYSAFCFLGFLFCLVFIRETRGLTDLQKKTVYSPKTGSIELAKIHAEVQ